MNSNDVIRSVATACLILLCSLASTQNPRYRQISRLGGANPATPSAQLIPSALNAANAQSKVRVNYPSLPLAFEINQGQTDSRVKFLARGQGYALFLTSSEAVLNLSGRTLRSHGRAASSAALRIGLKGGNPATQVTGQEELPGISNYFTGNDPKNWKTNIPQYARVLYRDVYPGIDLLYYGNQRQLEYDIAVAPGVDPRQVRFAVDGSERLRLNRSGDLVLRTTNGEVLWHKPLVYQKVNGSKRFVAGQYRVHSGREFGFQVGEYDRSKPLVIDPVLSYSTYIGGSHDDWFGCVAIDTAGNAYGAGFTQSSDFPVVNPLPTDTHFAGGTYDATIVKLNPTGTAQLYATYLGGSGDEWVRGIAVDSSGNAYVAGFTSSSNFPTMNPYQSVLHGTPPNAQNGYLAKLDPAGSALLYSSYLGGTGIDFVRGIAADNNGNAYVVGYTSSSDFPIQNALQAGYAGGPNDAFVAKFDTTASASGSLMYSTYLGGTGDDQAIAVTIDSSGEVYVTGSTTSTDFPVLNPFQINPGGANDVFLSKINASDSALVFSTYLGGGGDDIAHGIAVDNTGIYVVGGTTSTNFPTVNPVQAVNGGLDDAFLTKFDPTGSSLIYSTYYGGSSNEYGLTMAVDGSGRIFLAGTTTSTDFPVVQPIQSTNAGNFDGFVIAFSASGSQIIYATYFGGNSFDEIQGIAVDATGNAYIAGETFSNNLRVTSGVVQPNYGGNGDAFLAKIQYPDYTINITNSPQSALVTQQATFSGILTALNGYGSAVTLSCGTGAPAACMVTPSANVTPTSSGVPFTVGVSSTKSTNYVFPINAVGTDAAHIPHSANISFSSRPDFTLASSSASQTVKAGIAAQYTLNFAPVGDKTLVNGVTYSCSPVGFPTSSTCTFSPAQLVAGTPGPSNVTLTIVTAGPAAALRRPRAVFAFCTAFPVTALFLAGLLDGQTLQRRMAIYAAMGVMLLVLAVFQTACGGGGNSGGVSSPKGGTSPGTYTITINAGEDSGTTIVQHSATVTLVVQ